MLFFLVLLQDKHFAGSSYHLKVRERTIMQEIFLNGPAQATFAVYEDFLTYKSGIYRHVSGSQLGAHAVKIMVCISLLFHSPYSNLAAFLSLLRFWFADGVSRCIAGMGCREWQKVLVNRQFVESGLSIIFSFCFAALPCFCLIACYYFSLFLLFIFLPIPPSFLLSFPHSSLQLFPVRCFDFVLIFCFVLHHHFLRSAAPFIHPHFLSFPPRSFSFTVLFFPSFRLYLFVYCSHSFHCLLLRVGVRKASSRCCEEKTNVTLNWG